jgi:hypothetical protein
MSGVALTDTFLSTRVAFLPHPRLLLGSQDPLAWGQLASLSHTRHRCDPARASADGGLNSPPQRLPYDHVPATSLVMLTPS